MDDFDAEREALMAVALDGGLYGPIRLRTEIDAALRRAHTAGERSMREATIAALGTLHTDEAPDCWRQAVRACIAKVPLTTEVTDGE